MSVYFVTDTLLPIEAVTTMGIHAKPNSKNPLGFFGTGLKYAVAIIIRLGGEVTFHIDGIEYVFYTTPSDFRGTVVNHVRMKKRKGVLASWRYEKLPFTTDLGKNWEPWQAFRELITNTYDEDGDFQFHMPDQLGGRTVIKVTCPEVEKYALDSNMHHVYLHNTDLPIVFENDDIVVYDQQSDYMYYKNVRVHKFPIKARFTSVLKQGVELSEDRSIKDQYDALNQISLAVDGMSKEILDTLFVDHSQFFESHHLTYYGVKDTEEGGLRAYVNSRHDYKFGYYVGSLKYEDPIKKDHNFDVHYRAMVIAKSLSRMAEDDYYESPLVRDFVDWVRSENLFDTVSIVAESDITEPLEIPEWIKGMM